MTDHDVTVYIRHMLDRADEALLFCRGRARTQLDHDVMFRYAVIHALEVLGEAATRVPDATRSTFPDVPWPQVVGLRNRLVHGYDTIDLDIVWRIVQDDLAPLTEALREGLRKLDAAP